MAPLEWLRQSATRRFDAIQHYSLVENASKRLNVPKRMSGLFMRILLYLAGAVIVSGLILYKVRRPVRDRLARPQETSLS